LFLYQGLLPFLVVCGSLEAKAWVASCPLQRPACWPGVRQAGCGRPADRVGVPASLPGCARQWTRRWPNGGSSARGVAQVGAPAPAAAWWNCAPLVAQGVERRWLRGRRGAPRPAQQTGPRGHFLLRSGVSELDVERELHQAQAGSLCLFPRPMRRASRPLLSAAALFPPPPFRPLHPDLAGARVTRRCLGTPLPYWCSCGRCGCWYSCGRCGCCSGGRRCGGLLGRPAAPPLLEGSSCFLGLRVGYAIVQGLFCKATDARPILTIRTLDPMVGRSWRRGHAPRPRYWPSFVGRRCVGKSNVLCSYDYRSNKNFR
jgi:hypothetical protein